MGIISAAFIAGCLMLAAASAAWGQTPESVLGTADGGYHLFTPGEVVEAGDGASNADVHTLETQIQNIRQVPIPGTSKDGEVLTRDSTIQGADWGWKPLPSATGLSDAVPKVESGGGAAGTATTASRGDHVHPAASGGGAATPLSDLTPKVESGAGTPGTAKSASRGDHVHPLIPLSALGGNPAASTAGYCATLNAAKTAFAYQRCGSHLLSNSTPNRDAATPRAGTSFLASRADHVHEYRGGGVTLSDATPKKESGGGAAGTATTASRGDHVHPGGGDVDFGGYCVFDTARLNSTDRLKLRPGVNNAVFINIDETNETAQVPVNVPQREGGNDSGFKVGFRGLTQVHNFTYVSSTGAWTSTASTGTVSVLDCSTPADDPMVCSFTKRAAPLSNAETSFRWAPPPDDKSVIFTTSTVPTPWIGRSGDVRVPITTGIPSSFHIVDPNKDGAFTQKFEVRDGTPTPRPSYFLSTRADFDHSENDWSAPATVDNRNYFINARPKAWIDAVWSLDCKVSEAGSASVELTERASNSSTTYDPGTTELHVYRDVRDDADFYRAFIAPAAGSSVTLPELIAISRSDANVWSVEKDEEAPPSWDIYTLDAPTGGDGEDERIPTPERNKGGQYLVSNNVESYGLSSLFGPNAWQIPEPKSADSLKVLRANSAGDGYEFGSTQVFLSSGVGKVQRVAPVAKAGGQVFSAARVDHQHGVDSSLYGAGATAIKTGSADAGTAATVSRSDHAHNFPTGLYGSPVAVGSANADGTATTLARSDHVHSQGNSVATRGQLDDVQEQVDALAALTADLSLPVHVDTTYQNVNMDGSEGGIAVAGTWTLATAKSATYAAPSVTNKNGFAAFRIPVGADIRHYRIRITGGVTLTWPLNNLRLLGTDNLWRYIELASRLTTDETLALQVSGHTISETTFNGHLGPDAAASLADHTDVLLWTDTRTSAVWGAGHTLGDLVGEAIYNGMASAPRWRRLEVEIEYSTGDPALYEYALGVIGLARDGSSAKGNNKVTLHGMARLGATLDIKIELPVGNDVRTSISKMQISGCTWCQSGTTFKVKLYGVR